jgi:hypothetical protein
VPRLTDKTGVRLARSASDCTYPNGAREVFVPGSSAQLATLRIKSIEMD